MIGRSINHYKILEKLGEGGMGVVYLAEDTKLQRKVALKFLPENLTKDEAMKQRFVNEARAASALDHANICTLHEINETDDGQMYITMAHYTGETLKEKIKKGSLEINEAINITIQIARGLARAHQEGIIHRDIKPANTMITEHGEAKILDFGLAKLMQVSDLTKTGMTMGTVAYMSPEQGQGLAVDNRTDIWSLGVLLYEMLTAETPFTGEYDQAIIYSLINEKHRPPSELNNSLPKELDIVVEHALAKKPEERYESMEEMLADLLVLYNDENDVSNAKNLKRLKRSKQKTLFTLLTITVILLLIITSIWFSKGILTTEEPDNQVTIAVLPLKGFGEEASQDWFRDSMTDALNTSLTKIGGLRVISQNSTMHYKDNPKPISEIAKDLGVNYIIDASVVKVEDQVRLSAKLVNVTRDENIWAENYQRSFSNILKIQAEFAQAISHEVSVQLTSREKRLFQQTKEINPEAYAAQLRGRYLSDLIGSKEFIQAPEQFRKAIELEPEYADAYAGLAYFYVSYGAIGLLEPEESYTKAKEFARKALTLDPYSSEAYTSLGYAGLLFSTDWNEIKNNLKKAIDLNQSNTRALQWYAFYLSTQAKHNEAILNMKKARRLDPLTPILFNLTGLMHYFARNYDKAIEIFHQSIQTHPNIAIVYNWLSCAQTELGLLEEALKNNQKAIELLSGSSYLNNWLGRIYALQGEKVKALQIITNYPEENHKIAIVYAALGENDKAFEYIEKWLSKQNHVVLLKVAPWWDPLRSDPRFQDLLNKVGLGE